MQCLHSAHSDSIRYGTIRGVRDNRAKKSQCWLLLVVDWIFGKVLGFVYGRRTIKSGKAL